MKRRTNPNTTTTAPQAHIQPAGREHVSVRSVSQVFYNKGQPLTALHNINLTVGWGQFVAIIGPSGCGKSTLLRIVGGLLSPTEGAVSINGHQPREAQRDKEIGLVFQDPALLPWRTVLHNITLPLEVNRRDGHRGRPQELLEMVGLEQFADYYPRQLSGGMQQRVAIARALAFDPPLLLMDEPFGSLDEITREAMRYELLRLWQGYRKTVLFVTHSIPEAVTLADRVVVMTPRPGKVKAMLDIDIPRPRGEEMERQDAFRMYVAQLRSLLRTEGA